MWSVHVLTQKWCTAAPLIPSCVCSKWMWTLHSWAKTHKFMSFAKLMIWESELFTLIMKLSLPWWLFCQIIFWSSVWKNVNCWANINLKSSQFMRTCIWCQTTGQKSKCCLWPDLSEGVFLQILNSLVALDSCNYSLDVREYDGSRPLPQWSASSEFVGHSKDSFHVCVYWVLLFGILSHSPLVLCEMNQGKSVWVVHFVVCLSVCTGHASGSALCAQGWFSVLLLLCVPLPLCAHLFYPPISSTPESNTSSCWVTRMCQSLPWLMEELCPAPLLQSLCILHGPFPSSHNPCYVLPCLGTLCALGFSFCYGERVVWCTDHYGYDRDSC